MHKVVELILKRMESHPEEFVDARMKQMIEPYRQYLTTEEKEALKAKERDIHLDTLHVRVMKQILAEKEEKVDAEAYRTAAQHQAIAQAQQAQQAQWANMRSMHSQLGNLGNGVVSSSNGGATGASQPQPKQLTPRTWTNAGIHYMLNSNGQVFYSKDSTNWKEL